MAQRISRFMAAIFLLVGLSAFAQTKLTLIYWDPSHKDIQDKINGMFIQENPGVTVEMEQVPGDQYDQVMKTRLLAGNGPDVMFYWGFAINRYGRQGFYGDITNESYAKNILPAYLSFATYNGKIWGVPLNVNTYGVFYNKTLFAKAGITAMPKTYADFLAICEKLKKAGITPLARGAKDLWTGLHETGPLEANFVLGPDPTFQYDLYTGKTTFSTNAGFRDYLKRYIELVSKDYFVKGALGLDHTQATQLLADGKVAMEMFLSLGYGEIVGFNKDAQVGYFPLPDDNGTVYWSGAPDNGIGYWAKGKNIPLAKKLVGFYARPDINQLFNDSIQTLPCIKGANPKLAAPVAQLAGDLSKAKTLFTWFDGPWPMKASDVYRTAIQAIHSGDTDIDKITKALDQAYSENKMDPAVVPVAASDR